jgi:hypothetical protein
MAKEEIGGDWGEMEKKNGGEIFVAQAQIPPSMRQSAHKYIFYIL